MCGIVGVASMNTNMALSDNEIRRFHNLLYCSAMRGTDSTGIFLITKTGIASYKEAFHPADFVYDVRYRKWFAKQKDVLAIFGHTRAATSGKINWNNAHPFHIDDKIVFMHNGNVKYLPGYNIEKFSVDSLALGTAIAEKKPEEVFKEATGAMACVWVDIRTREISIYRNSERPLAWIQPNGGPTAYIASEGGMLKWVLGRESLPGDPTDFPIRKIQKYSYKVDGPVTKEEIDVPYYTYNHSVTDWDENGEYVKWRYGYTPNVPTVVTPPPKTVVTPKTETTPILKDKVDNDFLALTSIGPFKKGERIIFSPWDMKPSTRDPSKYVLKGTLITTNDKDKDYELNDIVFYSPLSYMETNELFEQQLLSGKVVSLMYRPKEPDFEKRLLIVVTEVMAAGVVKC